MGFQKILNGLIPGEKFFRKNYYNASFGTRILDFGLENFFWASVFNLFWGIGFSAGNEMNNVTTEINMKGRNIYKIIERQAVKSLGPGATFFYNVYSKNGINYKELPSKYKTENCKIDKFLND